jgi:hypothetical protein
MKKLYIATFAAFGVAPLAGCALQPGEVAGDGTEQSAPALTRSAAAGADHTPLQVASDHVPASKDVMLQAGPALDGRAAAAASGDAPTGGITGPLAQWYTGLLAAGAQQHWVWNNAGSGVYKVGFAPFEATTTTACQFQVIRSWDVQQPGGEREFHFIIENTASISCGANVLLQSQVAAASWSTGTVSPGATQGWTWNNANPLTAAHFVNVSPTGATGTSTCELEVTRSWYSQQPGGERELHFYLKNVGSIACGGTVLLATNVDANSSWPTGTISPGGAVAWFWNNANPLNRVYVPGVSPLGATSTTSCQLELLPSYYVEMLDSDQTTQRRYYIGVKNVGTISCSGTVLLNYLDPSNTSSLPVNLYPQQTNSWCWAASGEMVMSYLGGMTSQCEQANQRFGRTDCCNTPTPTACIQGGWPEFAKYGFTYNTGGALSWDAVKGQIDVRRTPFAFSWGWDGGGGHMMVLTGYKVINGQNWVSINDPWSPHTGSQRDILYSDYVDGAGYSHWTDYYNVAWN